MSLIGPMTWSLTIERLPRSSLSEHSPIHGKDWRAGSGKDKRMFWSSGKAHGKGVRRQISSKGREGRGSVDLQDIYS